MKLLTKRQIESIDKKLAARQSEVGKVRDKLDATIYELEMLSSDCDQALDLLQDARDALSRLV